jgi:hypothetical protein
MASLDTTINGYDFTAYYTCSVIKNAHGYLSDNITKYDIDLTEVELADSTINILDLLPGDIIDKLYEEIIKVEAN